jgi:hypothetical protein
MEMHFYQTTRRQIAKGNTLHCQGCENLKRIKFLLLESTRDPN